MTDDGRDETALPPGQRFAESMPLTHYGPVPKYRPETWRLIVSGATGDGAEHHLDPDAVAALTRSRVVADMHCVKRWSSLGNTWEGVPGSALLAAVPPAAHVTHVMAWAEYGYSATVRLSDLAHPDTILATHLDGAPLTPERGFPLRLIMPHLYAWKGPKWLRGLEYLAEPRRGFWEERGYHVIGDPWQEQRYSYQE